MYKTTILVSGVAALLGLTTACSSSPDRGAGGAAVPATTNDIGTVLLIGDSVAASEAIPLTEAFAASNVRFKSLAADGGGNVVGPFADQTWKTLPTKIADARPSVVIYQITTYDWGTEAEQRDAYTKLSRTVTDAGAKLVMVTMPPIRPDDFYRPHMADLDRTAKIAAQVTAAAQGHVLQASAVWGDTYQRERDGKVDRSSDGIHPCPQGAARFTRWLLGELTAVLPGFTPAAPAAWANSGWSADGRFVGC